MSVVIGGLVANRLVDAAATRRAHTIERELAHTKLDKNDVLRLIVSSDSSLPHLTGNPLVKPRLSPPQAVVIDASYAWARRCVVVEVEGARRTYVSSNPKLC